MDQSSKLPLDENAGLMRKADDGDIEAFKHLQQRFAPLLKEFFVMWGVDRYSAGDFVQKVFIRLWEQRGSFRRESSFETYLFGIARNTLYKEIRRSRRITKISSKKHPESDGDTGKILSQPEAELYFQELTDAIEAAKTKLTDQQYQALEFSQASEVPLSKILEELGCSEGAYKSHLKRARKRLRELSAPFFIDKEKRKKS